MGAARVRHGMCEIAFRRQKRPLFWVMLNALTTAECYYSTSRVLGYFCPMGVAHLQGIPVAGVRS
jgi:hypothetical protein